MSACTSCAKVMPNWVKYSNEKKYIKNHAVTGKPDENTFARQPDNSDQLLYR
tara:strand:- start:562 stop:717 length:156 start_codon:yes stop_codon:yes gene_type:complete